MTSHEDLYPTDGNSFVTDDIDRDFIEHEWKQEFHGVNYIVVLMVNGPILTLEAEQVDTNERWSGEFTAEYIEEITHKARSFKKFETFVKMLMSAFSKESDSVFAELLTYTDLELMKARKLGKSTTTSNNPGVSSSASVSSAATSNTLNTNTNKSSLKRYVILTYQGEFDRVHYPLPLAFEDVPNSDGLRRTIKRLRDKLNTRANVVGISDGVSGGYAATDDLPSSKEARHMISNLRKENTELRHRLRQAESRIARAKKDKDLYNITGPNPKPMNASSGPSNMSHAELSAEVSKLRKQYDSIKKEFTDTKIAYDRLQTTSSKEINRWKSISGLTQKNKREEASASSNGARTTSESTVSELRRRISSLQTELENERLSHKKTISSHRREISEMLRSKTPNYSKMNEKWRSAPSSGYGSRSKDSTIRSKSSQSRRMSYQSGFASDSSTERSSRRNTTGGSFTHRSASGSPTTARRNRTAGTYNRPAHSSLSPSRPNTDGSRRNASNSKGYRSSSLGGRFDPTAYTKEKARRLEMARSRDRPGWGSGVSDSKDSLRSMSPGPSPVGSRAGSRGRQGQRASKSRKASAVQSSTESQVKSSRTKNTSKSTTKKRNIASGTKYVESPKQSNVRSRSQSSRSTKKNMQMQEVSYNPFESFVASDNFTENSVASATDNRDGSTISSEGRTYKVMSVTSKLPSAVTVPSLDAKPPSLVNSPANRGRASSGAFISGTLTPSASVEFKNRSLKESLENMENVQSNDNNSNSNREANQLTPMTEAAANVLSGLKTSDADAEYSDIDRRIIALQSFLDNARDKFNPNHAANTNTTEDIVDK